MESIKSIEAECSASRINALDKAVEDGYSVDFQSIQALLFGDSAGKRHCCGGRE